MKNYLFLILLIFFSRFAFGQSTNFSINEIDSIVKLIDSTSISGGIIDYYFHKKGKKEKKRKPVGGGADWFYTSSSGKELLKVVRETSIGSENFDNYYFYKDSLIYLRIFNGTFTENKMKMNWEGKYYFQNGVLIFKQDDVNYPFVFNPKKFLDTSRQFFKKENWGSLKF
jgi:hypothetical protein